MYRNDRSAPPYFVKKIVKGIFMLLFVILFMVLIGFVIQYLWNHILVEVTDVKPLSYWQAVGLFALSRILFGGFRFGRRGRKKWSSKRHQWRQKWGNMSGEEKEEMKARWRARCGK